MFKERGQGFPCLFLYYALCLNSLNLNRLNCLNRLDFGMSEITQ